MCSWISETIGTRNTVSVLPLAKTHAREILHKMKHFKSNEEEFWKSLTETLEVDVRSKFQTQRAIAAAQNTQKGVCELPFDNCVVRYEWNEDRVIEITDVLPAELSVKTIAPDYINSEICEGQECEE